MRFRQVAFGLLLPHLHRLIGKVASLGVVSLISSTPATQDKAVQYSEFCAVFNGLSEGDRKILIMMGIEGVRQDAAAAAMGIAVGTVKSRLFRARRRFRDGLDKDRPNSRLMSAISGSSSALRFARQEGR